MTEQQAPQGPRTVAERLDERRQHLVNAQSIQQSLINEAQAKMREAERVGQDVFRLEGAINDLQLVLEDQQLMERLRQSEAVGETEAELRLDEPDSDLAGPRKRVKRNTEPLHEVAL